MAKIKTRPSILSIMSILLASIGSAVLIVVAFGELLPRPWLPFLFGGFFVACVFTWYWFAYIRPAELRKKLPITSKELKRERDQFYDNLPH